MDMLMVEHQMKELAQYTLVRNNDDKHANYSHSVKADPIWSH